jgi:hypothetical protein
MGGRFLAPLKWLVMVIGVVNVSGCLVLTAGFAQGTLSLGDARAYATMLGFATLIVSFSGVFVALCLAALARKTTGRDNTITRWIEGNSISQFAKDRRT